MTPVLEEIWADKAATRHKGRFFKNGATVSMLMKVAPQIRDDDLEAAERKFNAKHGGADNAYKFAFIRGADPVPMSVDFRQLDFAATQGKGETRIALAAGVPAAILGISEGLAGSALNAGNFGAARRLFVDTTIRHLWAMSMPALQGLLDVPAGARLVVDDRQLPFLREDSADTASIQSQQSTTISTLVAAGWNPDAAVAFVVGDELGALTGAHSGLYSVQLQPAGATTTTGGDA